VNRLLSCSLFIGKCSTGRSGNLFLAAVKVSVSGFNRQGSHCQNAIFLHRPPSKDTANLVRKWDKVLGIRGHIHQAPLC